MASTSTAARTPEMDRWLVSLAPELKVALESGSDFQTKADAQMPSLRAPVLEFGASPPEKLSGGPAKAGFEIEVRTVQFTAVKTKYGDLKLSSTYKLSPAVGGGPSDSSIGSSTTRTSKDKSDGRAAGVKQQFSYKDVGDMEPFKGFKLADVSVGIETEFSGDEVSIAGTFVFTITTEAFKAPSSAKLFLFKAKEGEGIKAPGVEFKVAPVSFKLKLGAIETTVQAEFKAGFMIDVKKVGQEVGLKIVEKLATDALKREAEKQGLKFLGREAAAEFLTKSFGPLAAAFGVGLDIGQLLNAFTVAPKVAGATDDAILGDLNERFQKAGTLGKIGLIYTNKERIVAALIASGVAGAVAGIGDVLLFKLMGLDKLPDFSQAIAAFKDLLAAIPNVGDAAGDMIFSNIIKLGIKFNPKYHKVSDPSLAIVAAGVYVAIHPYFKKKGGIDEIISMRIDSVDTPEADLAKVAKFIFDLRLNYAGMIDLTDVKSVAMSFLDLNVSTFQGFLETNKLIKYSITLPNELSLDHVDQRLVDDVFL